MIETEVNNLKKSIKIQSQEVESMGGSGGGGGSGVGVGSVVGASSGLKDSAKKTLKLKGSVNHVCILPI